MKSLKVDFYELIMAMQDQSRDINEYYLDTQTDEVIWVDRFLFDQIEAGEEPDMELVPAWQQKQLEAMRAILEDTEERYQRVPEVWSHEAYEIKVGCCGIAWRLAIFITFKPLKRLIEGYNKKAKPF